MELLSSVCLKLQFERNALYLFKLPYCFGEFISYMILRDWILCSYLQAENSLVLCATDSQSVTTGCWGLLKFLLQPSCSALGIFHFFLFVPHHFHLLTTVSVHTEHVGIYHAPYLTQVCPHSPHSTGVLCWRIKEIDVGSLSNFPLIQSNKSTVEGDLDSHKADAFC